VHTATAGHIIGMHTNHRATARNNAGDSGPRREGTATVREEWAIRWGNGVVTPPYDHRDQAERRLLHEAGRSYGGAAHPTVVCRTVTVTDWAVPPVSPVLDPSVKREPVVGARVRMRHFPSITGTVFSCCAPSIRVRWDHDSKEQELAVNMVEAETP